EIGVNWVESASIETGRRRLRRIGVDGIRSASTGDKSINQGLCDKIRELESECGLLDVP
ncbi:hypothetical protein KI387_030763, partial [Taxus chinensis]